MKYIYNLWGVHKAKMHLCESDYKHLIIKHLKNE